VPISQLYSALTRKYLPPGLGLAWQIIVGVLAVGCLGAVFVYFQYMDGAVLNPWNQAVGFLIEYAALVFLCAMILCTVACIKSESHSGWRIVFGSLLGCVLFCIFVLAFQMGSPSNLLYYFFPFIGFSVVCLEFFRFVFTRIFRWCKNRDNGGVDDTLPPE
jgi:hypothetical protein